MNTAYVWNQQEYVYVEWACVFGLLAVNTCSNWIVSLSISRSKSILYSAFPTQKLMDSSIPIKPNSNQMLTFFYCPTTWSSTIYAIMPCPYLSTPTPFIFNLQKSPPKIFIFLRISTAFFQFYYLLPPIVNQFFKCLSPG